MWEEKPRSGKTSNKHACCCREKPQEGQEYIQDLYELLIKIYSYNILKINADKTAFLHYKINDDQPDTNITTESNEIIKKNKTIK